MRFGREWSMCSCTFASSSCAQRIRIRQSWSVYTPRHCRDPLASVHLAPPSAPPRDCPSLLVGDGDAQVRGISFSSPWAFEMFFSCGSGFQFISLQSLENYSPSQISEVVRKLCLVWAALSAWLLGKLCARSQLIIYTEEPAEDLTAVVIFVKAPKFDLLQFRYQLTQVPTTERLSPFRRHILWLTT